jgi:hypothetical protein
MSLDDYEYLNEKWVVKIKQIPHFGKQRSKQTKKEP